VQQLQVLCPQRGADKVTPVILPPGRLRLVTRPVVTGSSAVTKTIGMVVVAALAASAAAWEPAMIKTTGQRTKSAASDGSRSCLFSAQRYSMARFWPTFVQKRTDALVVASDPFFYGRRDQLAALAARHTLPAIYSDREYIADGGLMSYGASITDAYRQTGVFTGRILKGDKPGDLPVQQAVKIELTVNLQAAKALGIEMPLSLLLRINEAIE
jgi:ABC-type uncharacterized transport system substrate-binding protein